MSPRAACRLETLGFQEVFDYVVGISDWKAANLPVEGEATSSGPIVADAIRPDVPTCGPSERLAEVEKRVRKAGWEDCLVIDCDDMVIGRLRSKSWDADPDLTVVEVMESGPSTVRPDQRLDRLLKRMDRRPTPLVVVTTPQGSLLGVILREEAHQLLAGESPELIWGECDSCPGQWRSA